MTSSVQEKSYLRNFIPYAFAAALVSLCGGFTAQVPAAVVADLGLDEAFTTWITLAQAMSMAACAPVLGKISDLFGRRATLLFGILLILAGQFFIGVSVGVTTIIIGRLLAGAGGGAIAPAVIGYITAEFPPAEMGRGFKYYMLIASGMVIVGPTIGGLIMSFWNWRAVLFVCVALSLLALLFCLKMAPKSASDKKPLRNFDAFGGIFIFVFFSLAMCVPQLGQSYGWASQGTIVVGAAALIALLILIFAEKRAKSPILSGSFMMRKAFILPVAALFLTQGLLTACMTNTIVFVMYAQPGNTLVSSLSISIMYIGMTLGAMFIGPAAEKKEPRYVSAFSLVFCLVGVALQFLYSDASGFIVFAAALFLIGLGLGGNTTIFMKVALSGLGPAEAGAGSGTYSVFRDLASPFGVAFFVPMFTSRIASLGTIPAMDSVTKVQLAFVAAGIVICLLLPKIYAESPVTQP